ncbi:hypothetical protein BDR07DRAFT_1442835, partial [Suillus spraguei]
SFDLLWAPDNVTLPLLALVGVVLRVQSVLLCFHFIFNTALIFLQSFDLLWAPDNVALPLLALVGVVLRVQSVLLCFSFLFNTALVFSFFRLCFCRLSPCIVRHLALLVLNSP